MFRNYVKIALRNIVKNKSHSIINISGLAVGMACSIMILLWVQDEISYDKFHENINNIYKVYERNVKSDGISYSSTLPAPIGSGIERAVPGISNFTRIYNRHYSLGHENHSYDLRGAIVDSSFLDIFSFALVKGDRNSALSEVNSIILTEDVADRIFGNENPVGKIVTVDGTNNLMITGIVAQIPSNSSLQFEFLVPISLMEANGYDMSNWGDSRFRTFIQITDELSLSEISGKIRHFVQTQWPDTKSELHLQPLSDIHLHDLGGGGLITYIYIFLSIALIIILIACINFANLMTASASGRYKEIGIKKVVGADRFQLVRQFMGETLLIVIISLAVAWGLIELLLPEYNNFTGKEFSFEIMNNPEVIWASIGVMLLTVLLSGSYPALFLSSLMPISLINKSNYSGQVSSVGLIRKGLVIFQFILSIGLMICTITIYNQINYIEVKKLGLDKENIVCFRMDNLSDDYQAIKQELVQFPEIINATATLNPPAWMSVSTAGPKWEGMDENQGFTMALSFTDIDFIKTFGIEMAAGRPFSEEFPTDKGNAYVVNEAAVRAMHLDSPVGTKFSWNNIEGEIIGVTKDFHFRPLHYEIQPMAILVLEWYNYLCVKVDPNNLNRAIDNIKNVFT